MLTSAVRADDQTTTPASAQVSPQASAQAFQNGSRAVLEVAERLHRMEPEWVVFFREILGVDGVVRRTFSNPDSLVRFECSPEYARIREMLDDLRNRQRDQPTERHKHRVITVRMPRTLHETLKAEAEQMRVSVNTLCISKLMKLLDEGAHRHLNGGPAEGGEADL
jgi:predicted HicB family RNase H-like nuclease